MIEESNINHIQLFVVHLFLCWLWQENLYFIFILNSDKILGINQTLNFIVSFTNQCQVHSGFNYFTLICTAEILYSPPFYLNDKFLVHIFLVFTQDGKLQGLFFIEGGKDKTNFYKVEVYSVKVRDW